VHETSAMRSDLRNVKPNFDELHQRGQDNLIQFLRVEVELGHTFLKMSETTATPDHRARLLRTIGEAITTIDRFKDRIGDSSVRAELSREAAKLREIVTSRKNFNQNGAPRRIRTHATPRGISSRPARRGNSRSA
jgi:hypothetical protein